MSKHLNIKDLNDSTQLAPHIFLSQYNCGGIYKHEVHNYTNTGN